MTFDQLCGIALNRFGLFPRAFYRLSPLEFYEALQDYEDTFFGPIKIICKTIRMVGVVIHNSAFGRKKTDAIQDPQKLWKFQWETPKIQTAEEMKAVMMGVARAHNKKEQESESESTK